MIRHICFEYNIYTPRHDTTRHFQEVSSGRRKSLRSPVLLEHSLQTADRGSRLPVARYGLYERQKGRLAAAHHLGELRAVHGQHPVAAAAEVDGERLGRHIRPGRHVQRVGDPVPGEAHAATDGEQRGGRVHAQLHVLHEQREVEMQHAAHALHVQRLVVVVARFVAD